MRSSDTDIDLLELAGAVFRNWPSIVVGSLLFGSLAFGIASLIRPVYTAKTSLLPPQQQQSAAAAAISQLGTLAGLGSIASGRSPADQYVAILESTKIRRALIDQFNLVRVYDVEFPEDAEVEFDQKVKVSLGKKDGLITIEVDDWEPKRAAEIANSHVSQLRVLMNGLAISEAQQRRAFFEEQLNSTKNNLIRAQVELQRSGISEGALKTEPKAVAEGYIQLKTEIAATEVQLKSLRQVLTESAPELKQLVEKQATLRQQLARIEKQTNVRNDSDYVSKFREFKYQETLFEMFARQYELARVDESREGILIQVLDEAIPPERKSKPRRGRIALGGALGGALFLALLSIARGRKAKLGDAMSKSH